MGLNRGQQAAAAVAQEPADARSSALALMSTALGYIDGDPRIPLIIGVHLQTAIDALWVSTASGRLSNQLH